MSNLDAIVLVTNYGMGNGPQILGLKLIGKYLELLNQHDDLPVAMCFYTEGVKLTVEGSPVLGQLEALSKKGVRLIICSTCLDYYGLASKVKVGIVGGMVDIIEAQLKADKVISI
jgi:selenium metabolism protein YedF